MLLAFLLASVTGGILLAGLAVPAVTAAGSVSNATTGIFDEAPEGFEIEEPSQLSTMYAADGSVMASFYANLRIVVSSEEISQYIKDATVAIEDRRFFDHNGVDVEGLARAFVFNMFTGTSQGASTLTQQYVKNVKLEESRVKDDPLLMDEATRQTYGRKLEEARLAISVEKIYSKDQILTGYLNLAQYGTKVWGVEAAAQRYFGVTAAEVSLSQAALLAAIPQAPAKWDPTVDPAGAQQRRDAVLGDMLELGMITSAEHDEAVAISVVDLLSVHDRVSGCDTTGNMAYFCQYVVSEILQNPAYGETAEDRHTFLYRTGLQIYTTIDPYRQEAAFASITGTVPVNDASNIKIVLTAVEPGTGRIQAMAQNTNFGDPTDADPTATQVNLSVGTSHGGGLGFQTGSAFKALVLTQWLKNGNTLADMVDANRSEFPARDWTISCAPENRALFSPKNLDGHATGRISVLEATRKSVNKPFAEMGTQMDLCDLAATAESMGLKQGDGSALEIVPAMVLGTNNIAPLDMAAAFATFANEGTFCTPVAIERIVTAQGAEIAVPQTECNQVLVEEVVRGVNYALQEVTKPGGTGSAAALGGRPTAGKTGTANEDYYAWFTGYTPQLSTAVAMGHIEGLIPMLNVRINGRWYDQVYGGRLPAPTWRTFMAQAMDGVDVEGFPAPLLQRTVQGDLKSVPGVVGLSVQRAQEVLEDAGFAVRIAGEPVFSSSVAEGSVASQSPGSGARVVQSSVINLTLSKGPEPAPEPTPEPAPEPDAGGGDRGGGSRGGNN